MAFSPKLRGEQSVYQSSEVGKRSANSQGSSPPGDYFCDDRRYPTESSGKIKGPFARQRLLAGALHDPPLGSSSHANLTPEEAGIRLVVCAG